MRTTNIREIDGFGSSDTILTQNPPQSGEDLVSKWPVKVKHRKRTYAVIYRPCEGRDSYRVAWTAAGQRQMKSFRCYSGKEGARKFADDLVENLAKQNSVARLTSTQADDALTAIGVLNQFREATGRQVSLTTAVSAWCESSKRLGDRQVGEAVTDFLKNSANVQPKNIGEAVTDFVASIQPLTQAAEGKRAQLDPKHLYIRELQLRRFADTFPGYSICDLTKADIDLFMSTLGEQKTKSRNHRRVASAKTRNHYRATIRQFLDWAVRKDYLSGAHRLGEADGLRAERANAADTKFYSPAELVALLAATTDKLLPLRPLIAIGGLAGLRTSELLRLDWSNVWRVKGHIEVTTGTAKTRSRRLVEICPALAAWLKPYKAKTTGKLWDGHEVTFHQHCAELCHQAVMDNSGHEVPVTRELNGLRHGFCTHHYAKYTNENYTAAQAGTSPTIIHRNYRGLATRAEGSRWFKVIPKPSDGPDIAQGNKSAAKKK
jgi:integrase